MGRSAAMSALSEFLGPEVPGCEEADAHQAGFVWTTLPRHGRRPARFLGRSLLRADNRAAARRGSTISDWSDVEIYEVYAGGYVGAVRHISLSDDRVFFQNAWMARDGQGVIAALRAHDADSACPWEKPPAQACDLWDGLIGAIFGSEPRL
jgi:hypothetical protein